jgi:3'-phosphoadenosine 5'-phosphosulfate (PAPS) 3'-phosphatase
MGNSISSAVVVPRTWHGQGQKKTKKTAAKRQWHKAHQLGSSRVKAALVAYDVPPRAARKTADDEIAAATLWALSRGQTQAFVPGGFGVAGFCRKSAQ